ncbi:DUF805 domain-containing protein [Alphaproteobacteria bacterium GH1-50]|uniref:DUF805 domain-containing protein n=1 Tax=Kangsaoukella pontilimi TaxID=2691042 RepID=A0A7C9IK30_9RHOB|nr:DUF805 domain-containing protein [Kangsaoukella pontilimi]MXQ09302.1 DUF805 domain-containing protein [Kangsaoukella pontilimi]
MSFTEAVRTCFRKYITVSGRARRAEFWWFALFYLIVGAVLNAIDLSLFGPDTALLSPIFGLVMFVPSITVAVRRLHDRDMSGWWWLLNFIPLIGTLILLVIYMLPGTNGANRFGPDPIRGRDDGRGGGSGGYRDDDGDYSPSSIPRSGRP